MDQLESRLKAKVINSQINPPVDLWEKIENIQKEDDRKYPFAWFNKRLLTLTLISLVGVGLAAIYVNKSKFESKITSTASTVLNKKNSVTKLDLSDNTAYTNNTALLSEENNNINDDAIINFVPRKQLSSLKSEKKFANEPSSDKGWMMVLPKDDKTNSLAVSQENKSTQLNQTSVESTVFSNKIERLDKLNKLQKQVNPLVTQKKLKTPNPKSCYDFKNIDLRFKVEGYAGIGLPSRYLQSKSNDISDYLELKKVYETPQIAYNLGASVVAEINPRLAVSAGIQYAQIRELFDYYDPLYNRTIIIIDTIQNGNGTYVIQIDTVTQLGEKVRTTTNVFSQIDVPLIVGWSFPMKKDVFTFRIGPIFNLDFTAKGEYVDVNKNLRKYNNNQPFDQVYRTQTGVQLFGAVRFEKIINSKISVWSELYYKHSLTDWTVTTMPYKQRYNVGGVQFGFSSYLTKNKILK